MFKSVLLPIDLSSDESWSRAAPAAFSIARENGAPLHAVTVVPDFGSTMVGTYFEEGYEQRALHEAGEQMNEWVASQVPTDIDVHGHVLHGRIYDQIIQAADRLGCDVIVMGSHRPQLSDYLLGPNAASVVRHAKQSVFVVRPVS